MTNVRTVGEEIEACLRRAVGCALERKTGQQLGAEGIESWKKKGFTERVLEGSQKKKKKKQREPRSFSEGREPFFFSHWAAIFLSPGC